MKTSKLPFYLFISCVIFFAAFSSCKKGATPLITDLSKPTLVLTPNTLSGIAGDLVTVDYTSGSTIGIKDIKIEEQFQNLPIKVLSDTFFASKPKFSDLNFTYRIPDSATAGQKSVLTFTVRDTSGNSISKQATVTVTASRPRITVNQSNSTAHAGDSVIFTIVLKSSENNLDSLNITQSINNGSFTKVVGYSYNTSLVNTTYVYNVPKTALAGDKIALLFTVSNKSKVINFVSKYITVN